MIEKCSITEKGQDKVVENKMHQPVTLHAVNNRSPLRVLQIVFTVLALLSFAIGSVLLSFAWFTLGMSATGKDVGTAIEARAFAFIFLWPATMLAVWIFSTLALLMAKRWLLASLSLPVVIAIFYGVWWLIALYMLNVSGVMFTVLFILLNTGALWLARWFLKMRVNGNN